MTRCCEPVSGVSKVVRQEHGRLICTHPFVDLPAVLEMLRCFDLRRKPVFDIHDCRLGVLRDHPAEQVISVDISKHETAAMS